jgi:hypothetical protein
MNTVERLHQELDRLYRRAFLEFGAAALWNSRQLEHPAPADVLAVARVLRTKGDMNARRLAEEIEAAYRALD